MKMQKLCIITSTRADWGLLRPLARAIADSKRYCLQIVATNMHLMQRYGMTVDEIEEAGVGTIYRVPLSEQPDTPAGRALLAADCARGVAEMLEQLEPDAVIVLGDRFEILAAAMSAAVMRIPIIHLCGGETTRGAIDDKMRHAITQLASLHLTSTAEYRRRVIAMGNRPDTVVDCGAPGVWNVLNQPKLSRSELEESLGMDLSGRVALVTYHPVTAVDYDSAQGCVAMLSALDRHPELKLVITYPNNDAGSEAIIEVITRYAEKRPGRVALVRSLGMQRYLSLASICDVVVGNSSSGVVEIPSTGAVTVDIGDRQQGRIASESVIHCGTSEYEISKAIEEALSPRMQALAAQRRNPYFKPDTPQMMLRAIDRFMSNPTIVKDFYDYQGDRHDK